MMEEIESTVIICLPRSLAPSGLMLFQLISRILRLVGTVRACSICSVPASSIRQPCSRCSLMEELPLMADAGYEKQKRHSYLNITVTVHKVAALHSTDHGPLLS